MYKTNFLANGVLFPEQATYQELVFFPSCCIVLLVMYFSLLVSVWVYQQKEWDQIPPGQKFFFNICSQ